MFVDRVEIEVEAGKGGAGCSSFRRERFVPRGGPDGGDGGNGGSVILLAEDGVNNLALVAHRTTWKAERGGNGQGSNRRGRCGKDVVVKVPPGTIVRDAKERFILKDLVTCGDRIVAARGGKGGKGNAVFKSSTNRSPRECTPGEEGECRRLILELKLIADVGLIGMPNAGKSTMLSRLTRARPEIADYPFTTKTPHLGQVHVSFDQHFVMADIPGLIHGAHEGVGLGHEFLRHVERTRVFVHLIEPMPMDGSNPIENYHDIRNELIQYSAELRDRPEVVVVTKAELPDAQNVRDELANDLGRPVMLVSAVTGEHLNQLVTGILAQLDSLD